MADEKQEISIDSFLKQLSSEIESGLGERQISGAIKVELSVVKKIDVAGEIKFYVFGGGGGYQKEDLVKVSFSYYANQKRRPITPPFVARDQRDSSI